MRSPLSTEVAPLAPDGHTFQLFFNEDHTWPLTMQNE